MQSVTTGNLQFSRRGFLQFGAASGLSFALPPLTARAAELRGDERPKSLIVLWMEGGPSQLETWDPHPDTEFGGPTKSIPTSLPGLDIAAGLPRMAEQMHRLSVIRSLISKEGDHERASYYLKTGYRPDQTLKHPTLTAVAARQLTGEQLEIPAHVSLGNSNWPARGGYLGAKFDAFKVLDPGRNLRNLKSRVPDKRQQRRLDGLNVVSQSFRTRREARVDQTLHGDTIDKALKMMNSKQLEAFELESESQATIDAYGDSKFGRGCLVARRLVETGVRAIEVTLRGFDTHADNFTGHDTQNAILDPAFAALVDDLYERDLLDSTLVLCIGEFGRTPKINKLEGRDHWPNGFSCVLGGGGLMSGQIIGSTNPEESLAEPESPVEVKHLFATLMQAVGIDHKTEMFTPIGRPMLFSDGEPMENLLIP